MRWLTALRCAADIAERLRLPATARLSRPALAAFLICAQRAFCAATMAARPAADSLPRRRREDRRRRTTPDRKSTRLNSSHLVILYAVFCLKKKKTKI